MARRRSPAGHRSVHPSEADLAPPSTSLVAARESFRDTVPARSPEVPRRPPASGRLPMGWLAVAFAAGILAGWKILLALPMAAMTVPPRSATRRNAALLALAALLGAGRAAVDRLPAPDSIGRWIEPAAGPARLEAALVGDSQEQREGRTLRGWVRVRRIRIGEEWQAVSGKLQVRWPAGAGVFEYGDRLELTGLLRAGAAARSRHSFDEARWLWLKGASGVLTVSDPAGIARVAPGSGIWVGYRRWIGRLHRRLAEIAEESLDREPAGLLNGLLLGDGQGISRETWEAFRKTGTVHVLVVSGLHVGLVGAIQLMVLSVMRVPLKSRYTFLAVALASYCLLTGMNPPIVRATITGLLFCWAWGQGRETSSLNLLGAAGLAMLAADPRVIQDAGFQLSFASVVAILGVDSWIAPWAEGKISRWLLRPVAFSCAAWAATAPILLVQFGGFSWIAPVLNILVVPWVSLLITLGVLVYAGGLVCSGGGCFFGVLFGALGSSLLAVVKNAAGGTY